MSIVSKNFNSLITVTVIWSVNCSLLEISETQFYLVQKLMDHHDWMIAVYWFRNEEYIFWG